MNYVSETDFPYKADSLLKGQKANVDKNREFFFVTGALVPQLVGIFGLTARAKINDWVQLAALAERLQPHKLVRIRRDSEWQAMNGDIGPFADDIEASLQTTFTAKTKVICDFHAYLRQFPKARRELDRPAVLDFEARNDLENAIQAGTFSHAFKDAYRMANIGISNFRYPEASQNGNYDERFNRAGLKSTLPIGRKRATLFHEIGHGLKFHFSFGGHALVGTAIRREPKNNIATKKAAKVFCDKKRAAMHETFAYSFEMLVSESLRGTIYHYTPEEMGFAESQVAVHCRQLKTNPVKALLDLNEQLCKGRRKDLEPTQEPLAATMAVRYVKLLHAYFPDLVASTPC